MTTALGAVPYWKPRANNAPSSFPVLNRLPNTGLSVAAFAIHDASPEQSVPAGESPPAIYGVPETWLINDIKVAITTMGSEASNNNYRPPKFVAHVIRCGGNDLRRT
jgi:hypothetical protein